mgnify:CR=1 FL=1
MKEVRSFIKTASLTELEKAQQLINDAISKYTQQQKAKQEVLDLLKEKGLTLEDLSTAWNLMVRLLNGLAEAVVLKRLKVLSLKSF